MSNEKNHEPVYQAFYNSNGEKIEAPEFPKNDDSDPCVNVINFCCIAPVPEGFEFIGFNPALSAVCFDTSELSCCLEPNTVECEVDNPCNGILTCPVEIQAVRLVGTFRLTANVGPIIPKDGSEPGNCTANCTQAINVNQIIGFTCNQKIPCVPCFKFVPGGNTTFAPFIDACGRQAVQIFGFRNVEFIGCN